MTLDEIEEIRPSVGGFTAAMLGSLARSDQRGKDELVPMAERLGVDHQGLQQLITSSTWDYAAVRANVA